MQEAFNLNQPAISSEWAMQDYSMSRQAERRALIELAELKQGATVVDIQAAGGFLSDGVYEHLDGQVKCICVEPVTELRCRIDERFIKADDQIDNLVSIDSDSVDVVLGLAGLHHSPCIENTLKESLRVLKPQGVFAMCDVIKDSSIARWLNEFVNRYNPDGHQGHFFVSGEISDCLHRAGFRDISEQILNVPWVFESSKDIAHFFKGLFNLDLPEPEVEQAIPEYLEVVNKGTQLAVNWELIYVRAIK